MSEQRILLCMGTRPEIIKMAPLYHALNRRGVRPLLLHTGQHKDMASPMYDFFRLVPDYSLVLERRSEALSHLSALLLDKLGAAFHNIEPSAVMVHGDTSSAAMAALAAFYQQIPVGHVEAGLRSHHAYDPFPEEKNRELIARLARWHFAPTASARDNLLRENVTPGHIHVVGNTIVDAVRLAQTDFNDAIEQARQRRDGPLGRLERIAQGKRVVLVTAHRRENLGLPLVAIARAVRSLIESEPDLAFVWPVHSNPAVQSTVRAAFQDLPSAMAERLLLTAPLAYPDTIALLQQAWLTLTDSGGIQEEAACLNLPVLILRETTERGELIECGGGALVGTNHDAITGAVRRLLHNGAAYRAMCGAPNPFGDGYAADHIHDVLFRSDNAI